MATKLITTLSLNPSVVDPNVMAMQKRLNALGYTDSTGKALTTDGRFGPGTLYAVNAFKTNNNLGNTGLAAGEIGDQSWQALFSDAAVKSGAGKKTLVYFSQEDPKWAGILYSTHDDKTQTIGTSACGPTSAAMAISALTDDTVLPPVAADYAVKHGYRTYNDGTAWGFFADFCKLHGLKCQQTGSFDVVKAALQEDVMAIATMGPGHFTGGGHYVLIVGKSGADFEVYDPNPDNTKYGPDGLINQGVRNDGKVVAKESVFRKEAKQYWIISK
ncbi:C39 family peptidase [Paenibacillus glycanilyticus]|uniref:C39 family peptidase n=1 Tax=Paenibacillus glycanilyticus TaxID=126569 RepID=UPI00203B6201|nr:C39 family peptidase [Paenibacillus glycanilyticus]MCM3629815.1 C39 family peptidase [Paenibacillus glycanilyticus]